MNNAILKHLSDSINTLLGGHVEVVYKDSDNEGSYKYSSGFTVSNIDNNPNWDGDFILSKPLNEMIEYHVDEVVKHIIKNVCQEANLTEPVTICDIEKGAPFGTVVNEIILVPLTFNTDSIKYSHTNNLYTNIEDDLDQACIRNNTIVTPRGGLVCCELISRDYKRVEIKPNRYLWECKRGFLTPTNKKPKIELLPIKINVDVKEDEIKIQMQGLGECDYSGFNFTEVVYS